MNLVSDHGQSRKRVIIFGDSLPRPRPDLSASNDITLINETYPEQVRMKLPSHVILETIYIESLDTRDALDLEWNKMIVAFKMPDFVIYHLGVNDCAPRVFSKNSRSILLNPLFRRLTKDISLKAIHLFQRQIIRLVVRNKVYTDISLFESNLRSMIGEVRKYSPDCMFYAILIARVSRALDSRSIYYNSNIEKYNSVIRRVFQDRVFDPSLDDDSHLISDGIYLSRIGHKALAEKINIAALDSFDEA